MQLKPKPEPKVVKPSAHAKKQPDPASKLEGSDNEFDI